MEFKAFAYSNVRLKFSLNSFSIFGKAAQPNAPSGFVPETNTMFYTNSKHLFGHGNEINVEVLAESIVLIDVHA